MTEKQTAVEEAFGFRINVLGGFDVRPSESRPAGLQSRLLLAALSAARLADWNKHS
jgi:hypothetical protein